MNDDRVEAELRAALLEDDPGAVREELRRRVAAVPDEGGAGRRFVRSPYHSRFLAAAAALGTLVVVGGAIVGVVGLRPSLPGPVPSSGSATSGPSAPTPSVPASPANPAIVRTSAGTTSLEWAPDGKHLGLAGDGYEILDPSGAVMDHGDGDQITWIDSHRFATWTAAGSGGPSGQVVVHDLGGGPPVIVGDYGGDIVGSQHGALALPVAATYLRANATFVVWAAGGLSSPYSGRPLGWSGDGTTILVGVGPLSPGGAAGSNQGLKPALVSYPGPIVSRPLGNWTFDWRYRPSDSPDGRLLAFPCGWRGTAATCHQVVVDLKAGTVATVATQPPGLPLSWMASGELLLATAGYPNPGSLRTWRAGVASDTTLPAASWGVASVRGFVALETELPDGTSRVQVIDEKARTIANLPGGDDLRWSPDGSVLLVRDSQNGELRLLRIP